jgi:hypothetical protein
VVVHGAGAVRPQGSKHYRSALCYLTASGSKELGVWVSREDRCHMSEAAPWSEVAPLLGRLLIEFNNVEIETGLLVCSILNQERSIAGVFSAVLSFSQKIALVDALAAAKYLPSEIESQVQKILTEARRLNSIRNQVVHSEYSFESPDIDMPWLWWRKHRDRPQREKDFPVLVTASYSSIEISFLEKAVEDAGDLATRTSCLSNDVRKAFGKTQA